MILSHKHRFIFLKTNKTAGTSVEIALSRFCGPDDIIAPISPKDEKKRRGPGYRGAQNYRAPYSDYGIRDWGRLLLKGRPLPRFFNHMSATELLDYIERPVWDSYFTFCIERNPWDRLISLYFWRCRREPRPTITEFLDSGVPEILLKRGRELYSLDGDVAVDRIVRFEHLADDLEAVRSELGLPEPLALPQAKAGVRKDKRSYQEFYTAEERDRVAEMFSKEIELLGYEF